MGFDPIDVAGNPPEYTISDFTIGGPGHSGVNLNIESDGLHQRAQDYIDYSQMKGTADAHLKSIGNMTGDNIGALEQKYAELDSLVGEMEANQFADSTLVDQLIEARDAVENQITSEKQRQAELDAHKTDSLSQKINEQVDADNANVKAKSGRKFGFSPALPPGVVVDPSTQLEMVNRTAETVPSFTSITRKYDDYVQNLKGLSKAELEAGKPLGVASSVFGPTTPTMALGILKTAESGIAWMGEGIANIIHNGPAILPWERQGSLKLSKMQMENWFTNFFNKGDALLNTILHTDRFGHGVQEKPYSEQEIEDQRAKTLEGKLTWLGKINNSWRWLHREVPGMKQKSQFTHNIVDWTTMYRKAVENRYALDSAPVDIVQAYEMLVQGKDFEGISDYDARAYLFNQGTSGLATLASFATVGGGTAKLLGALSKSKAFVTLGTAYALNTAESGTIAMDSYQGTRQYLFGEQAGDEYLQMQEDAYQNTYDKAREEGRTTVSAEIRAERASQKVMDDWMAANKDAGDKIEQTAREAGDLSLRTNAMNIVLNLYIANKFAWGMGSTKKAATPLTRNVSKRAPFLLSDASTYRGAIKGVGKTVLFEGAQEYMEEGFVNMWAEKAGMAYGRGSFYGMGDALHDIFTRESLDQGFWGFILGGGQAFVAPAMTHSRRHKWWTQQQDNLAKIEKMLAPDGVDRYTTLMLDYAETLALDRKVQGLIAEGKTHEAAIQYDKMLHRQMLTSFKMGTTEALIQAYQAITNEQKYSDAVRARAVEAVTFIKDSEQDFLDSRDYFNGDAIFANRLEKRLRQQYGEQYITPLSTIMSKTATDALKSAVRSGELDTGNIPIQEFGSGEEIFTNSISSEEFQKEYDEIIASITGKEGIAAVRHYSQLLAARDENQQYLDELERQYNYMTKESTQKEAKQRTKLAKALDKAEDTLGKQKGTEAYEKTLNTILSRFEGKVSEETLNMVKEMWMQGNELASSSELSTVDTQIADNIGRNLVEPGPRAAGEKTRARDEISAEMTDVQERTEALRDRLEELHKQMAVAETQEEVEAVMGVVQKTTGELEQMANKQGVLEQEMKETFPPSEETNEILRNFVTLHNEIMEAAKATEEADMEAAATPRKYMDELSDEQKARAIEAAHEYASRFVTDHGRPATFEDMVRNMRQQEGGELTDEEIKQLWDVLVYGWENSELNQPASFESVYGRVFGDALTYLQEYGRELRQIIKDNTDRVADEKTADEAAVARDAQQHEDAQEAVDVQDGVPTPVLTIHAPPVFYLGNRTVDKNNPSQVLHDPYIDNVKISDPEFSWLGKTVKLVFPKFADDVLIPLWKKGMGQNGFSGNVKFGEWKKSLSYTDMPVDPRDIVSDNVTDTQKLNTSRVEVKSADTKTYDDGSRDAVVVLHDHQGQASEPVQVRLIDIEKSQHVVDHAPVFVHVDGHEKPVGYHHYVSYLEARMPQYDMVKMDGEDGLIEKNRRARRSLIVDGNPVTATIDGMNQGRITRIKDYKDPNLAEDSRLKPDNVAPISEMDPNAVIGYYTDTGEVIVGQNKPFNDDAREIIDQDDFRKIQSSLNQRGAFVILTHVGTEKGKKQYSVSLARYHVHERANPAGGENIKELSNKPSKEVASTVAAATAVYLAGGIGIDNKTNMPTDENAFINRTGLDQDTQKYQDQLKRVHAEVLRHTGLNLFILKDYEEFVNGFTYHQKPQGKNKTARFAALRKGVQKGGGVIGTHQGVIYLGVIGNMEHDLGNGEKTDFETWGYSRIVGTSEDPMSSANAAQQLKRMSMAVGNTVGRGRFNISEKALEDNKPVVLVTDMLNMTTEKVSDTYEGFLRGYLSTDFHTYEVSSAGKTWRALKMQNRAFSYVIDDVPATLSEQADSQIAGKLSIDPASLSKEEADRKLAEWEIATSLVDRPGIDMDESATPMWISEEGRREIAKVSFTIDGIPSDVQRLMKRRVLGDAIEGIMEGSFNEKNLRDHIESAFDRFVEDRRIYFRNAIAHANAMLDVSQQWGEGYADKFARAIKRSQDNLVLLDRFENNYDKLEDHAVLSVRRVMSLTRRDIENDESDIADEMEATARVKDYSAFVFEESAKDSMLYELRKFFFGINNSSIEVDPSTGQTTRVHTDLLFNIATPLPFDEPVDKVQSMLAGVPASLEMQIKKLRSYANAEPWVLDVIDKLIGNADKKIPPASSQVQRQFTSTMARHDLKMEYLSFRMTRNGNYTFRVVPSNSNEKTYRILKDWFNSFHLTPLFEVKNKITVLGENAMGDYRINLSEARRLLARYNEWTSGLLPVLNAPQPLVTALQSDENAWKQYADKRSVAIPSPLKEAITETIAKDAEKNNNQRRPIIFKDRAGNAYEISENEDGTFNFNSRPEKLDLNREYINWLKGFGIDLHSGAMAELISDGLVTKGGKRIPFATMFGKPGPNSNGIFNSLAFRLDEAVKAEEKMLAYEAVTAEYASNDPDASVIAEGLKKLDVASIDEVNGDDLMEDAVYSFGENNPIGQTIFRSLARLQSRYVATTVKSWRDSGKTINGITPGKFVTDRFDELVASTAGESEVLSQMLRDPYSSESLWLNLLEDPSYANQFLERFQVIHMSPTAMKEVGRRVFGDRGMQDLSEMDHETVKVGYFQNTFQGSLRKHWKVAGTSIPMRMATYFFPTLADKSTMIMARSAAFQFTPQMMGFNGSGYDFAAPVRKILFDQLALPEIKRIIRFYNNGGRNRYDQNGYRDGAHLFYIVPTLNNLTVNVQGKNMLLTEALEMMPHEAVIKQVEPHVTEAVTSYMSQILMEKMDDWVRTGIVEEVEGSTTTSARLKVVDNKYVATYLRGTTQDENSRAYAAMADYELNYHIAQANLAMTFTGDIANYYKDPAPGKTSTAMEKVEATLDNMTKRLPLLIAPGIPMAESYNAPYRQLFIDDVGSMARSIKDIIHMHTGKKVDKTTSDQIDEYFKAERAMRDAVLDPEQYRTYENSSAVSPSALMRLNNMRNELKKKYSDIVAITDFFDIQQITDSQELTTWKEHLSILEGLGRIDPSISGISSDELARARQILAEVDERGRPKNVNQLTEADKKLIYLVAQPIKPVYAGQHFDKVNEYMRMVYIKSSSYPLIPQLTAGLEIDALRQKMERFEKEDNNTVRLAFMSAAKVGGITQVFDRITDPGTGKVETIDRITYQELVNKPYEDIADRIQMSSLEMNRSNFRMQQDIPYKSFKRSQSDLVSLATQMTKLLFGDDAISALVDENGKNVGKEWWAEFNKLFYDLLTNRSTELYNDMGVIPGTGEAVDPILSMVSIQDIVLDEAKARGFSPLDIESLALTEDKTEFEIPLWMTTNADKFEALLNSIVTNKVIKTKMPGASYVAASELGYDFRTDLEGLTKAERSRIIYTSEDTSGVAPARLSEDGKFVNGKVLLTSKIRNNKTGKLLDLFEGVRVVNDRLVGKEGKYIKRNDSGNWVLKEGMIDPEVLTGPAFRIPSSGHVSLASMEIAGFLPPECGDLMIVPYELIAQKGLDFDIDKEYMYQYWHYTDGEGRVKVVREDEVSLSDIDNAIATAYKFRDLHKIYLEHQQRIDLLEKVADKFTPGNIGDVRADLDDIVSTIGERFENLTGSSDPAAIFMALEDLEALKMYRLQIIQNKMIDIHNKVLRHTAMQSRINRVLSTTDAEQQAVFLEGLRRGSSSRVSYTSTVYQRDKMFTGAAGKVGIGAYSMDVISHSQFNQALNTENPVRLVNVVSVPGEPDQQVKRSFRFGEMYTEDGILGERNSIVAGGKRGGRPLTDVLAERQNIAADNSTLQLMGKLGLNDMTLDVDKVLTLLGFDKGEDGNSISFLFLSQRVIDEYVRRVKNAKSLITPYLADAENVIFMQMMEEMKALGGTFDGSVQANVDTYDSDMTNGKLSENILAADPDINMDMAILHKFMDLRRYGRSLRNFQTSTNADSKGVGISMFEVQTRMEHLDRLTSTRGLSGLIQGKEALIGDYISAEGLSVTQKESLREGGYVEIGDNFVKPTTLVGAFNIIGVSTAYNLWGKRFFPMLSPGMGQVMGQVLDIVGDDQSSPLRTVERKYWIGQQVRRYLNSDKHNMLMGEDAKSERRRLFLETMDPYENVFDPSLTSYLQNLTTTIVDTENQFSEGIRIVKNNPLIKALEFEVHTNGAPSTSQYSNSAADMMDMDEMNDSIRFLMEIRAPLPAYKGEAYDTVKLAQDLILYAFMEGGVQQAVQFVRFVPPAYLRVTGYSERMRDITRALLNPDLNQRGADNIAKLFGWRGNNIASKLATQIIQHFPETVSITEDAFIRSNVTHEKPNYNDPVILENMLDADGNYRKFVSVYNQRAQRPYKRWFLYVHMGAGNYVPLNRLGVHGMFEYDMNAHLLEEGAGTILSGNAVRRNTAYARQGTDEAVSTASSFESADMFSVREKSDFYHSLEQVADGQLGEVSEIATALIPHLPAGLNLIVGQTGKAANMTYKNGLITVHPNAFRKLSKLDFARGLTKEAMHAIMDSEILTWMNRDGTWKDSSAKHPNEMVALKMVFEKAREVFPADAIQLIRDKIANRQLLTSNPTIAVYGGLASEAGAGYGVTDIVEFVEMMMTSTEFQQLMNSREYRSSGMTFFDKIMDIFLRILGRKGIDTSKRTITTEAVGLVSYIMEKKAGVNPFTSLATTSETSSTSAETVRFVERTSDPFEQSFRRQVFVKAVAEHYGANAIANADYLTARREAIEYREELDEIFQKWKASTYFVSEGGGVQQAIQDVLDMFSNVDESAMPEIAEVSEENDNFKCPF